ncbi:MAG TPA: hypothetical protein VN380_16595 [Thermoanaerobaculia bacterium]|jgi:hypothetical protein|nr:hypothetical protein [Thermoanaerobaculia bacterium]
MNFAQIAAAVKDVWDFLWPPIALIVVLLAITRAVAPKTNVVLALWLRARLDSEHQARMNEIVDRVGLGKTLAATFIFIGVFALYVTATVSTVVGAAIPPNISYFPDRILARRISDDDAACIWSRYPYTEGLRDAIDAARRDGHLKMVEEASNPWRESALAARRTFDAVKFLALWALAFAVAEAWRTRRFLRPAARAVIIMSLLSMLELIVFVHFLYCARQSVFTSVVDLTAIERVLGTCNERTRLTPDQKTAIDTMRRESWWKLSGATSDYVDFAVREVFRSGRASKK